jgi:N-acyl-D-aspartate/D-glutamate deacylase
MDAGVDGWEDLNGLRIPEIAEKWGTSSFDAMLRLSRESGGGALMLFHAYSGEPGNEKPLESVLSHDLCLFETDVILKSRGHSNPAGTGTFPKILGTYVREKKLLGLEEAVYRMTGASAERFGIKNRGFLSPGKAADIVLFDPDTISDTPPVGRTPAGRPKGISHVFLNGRHVVKEGLALDTARAGRMIRL